MTYIQRLPLLIVLLICFLPFQVNGQDGTVANVAVGVSIPSGDFANEDFSNPASGFAQVGFNLNLLFGYKFNDYVGFGGMITGNVHNYDYSAVRTGFEEEFDNDFQNIDQIYVNTRQWASGGLVAGGLFSVPATNRLAFDLKVMCGFLYVYSPELKITVESQTHPGWILMANDRDVAFAWDLGAGIRYSMSGKKYLIIQYDYLAAKPYFEDQQIIISTNNGEHESTNSFKQDMTMHNITIGLGYFIN